MKLVEINWHPDPRQLQQFGWTALVALPALGWFWSGGSLQVTAGLAVCGLLLALCGQFAPALLRPVFLALMVAALPIGIVVSELALLAIYFGVFLPIGLFFRLTGRDALQLRLDRSQKTYWQRKKPPQGAASYYRQS